MMPFPFDGSDELEDWDDDPGQWIAADHEMFDERDEDRPPTPDFQYPWHLDDDDELERYI